MAESTVKKVQALNCSGCGAALTLRSFEHALSVVCLQCLSVLDAKDPGLKVLQSFAERERVRPLIPLGARGKVRGDLYEVIGFQVRTIQVEGTPYSWHEYLLFNPFKGFRYLTQYEGHWNDVVTLRTMPSVVVSTSKPSVRFLSEMYTHFQTARAETTFVMGEFPWQIRVGETAEVKDYISPPRMLSSETTEFETVWSLGEYMSGAQLWQAFQLEGSPPPVRGTFANQVSPFQGRVSSMWRTCLFLLALTAVAGIAFGALARRDEVLRQSRSFVPRAGGESSFVTDVFELKGRPSNVQLLVRTDLSNNWAAFHVALINETSGHAYDLDLEASYYRGQDGGGAWTEGSPGVSVKIPTVPAGRYYLRVEPEMDANAPPVNYELLLRRDVPTMAWFWVAGFLILLPPTVYSLRASQFESARWQESDYAPDSSGNGDDSE